MALTVITSIPAVRIVVRGNDSYMEASKAAYDRAVVQLGTDALNLVDATVRLSDSAIMFTYSVIGDNAGATR